MLKIRVREGPDAKQLARSLKAHAPNLQCQVCGSNEFGLIDQPDIALRTVLGREFLDGKDEERLGVRKQPLATLICTRCGHLVQFAEAVLNGAPADAYGEDVGDE